MKKIIIGLVVLIVVVVIISLLPVGKNVPLESLDETSGRQLRGTVLAVNTDQMMADGPGLVTIQSDYGMGAVIAVPSMGRNLCVAKDNIADVYQIKAGDIVEVRGDIDAEGRLIPCASPDDYLRVVAQ